jgi:hypothetical protein
MKERKNVAKSDCSRKPKLNNSGMTLIEMMTAVASSMVVIAGAVIVLQMGMREFYMLHEQNKALESLERASLFLRIYTQNAVNVRGITTPIPNVTTADTDGFSDPTKGYVGGMALANGNAGWDSRLLVAGTHNNGRAYKIGVFLVENGGYDKNTLPEDELNHGSLFKPITIWYQVPDSTKAGPLASGVIYMDMNSIAGAAPDASDTFFTNFSAFRVEVVPTPVTPANPNGPAWQVVYYITVRYFLGGTKENWFYDPLVPAPATPLTIGYKEENREIRIGLRNNALSNSQIAATGVVERAQGPLYYFRLHMPRSGQIIR